MIRGYFDIVGLCLTGNLIIMIKKSEERRVLTLGSLCLRYYMKDTLNVKLKKHITNKNVEKYYFLIFSYICVYLFEIALFKCIIL